MAPVKRKASGVISGDDDPTPKRRSVRGQQVEVPELESNRKQGYTGLNGGYWARTSVSPSKRSIRAEGSLKENDSDEEAPSPSKRAVVRRQQANTLTPSTTGNREPPLTTRYRRKDQSTDVATPRATVITHSSPPISVHTDDDREDDFEGYAPPDSPTKSSITKANRSAQRKPRAVPSTSLGDSELVLLSAKQWGKGKVLGKEASVADTPTKRRGATDKRSVTKKVARPPSPSSDTRSDEDDELPRPVSVPRRPAKISPPVLSAAPLTPESIPKKLFPPHLETNKREETSSLPSIVPSATSPRKTGASSPSRLPRVLPGHLHSSLCAQKRAILCALTNPTPFSPPLADEDVQESTNEIAYKQLTTLLNGTTTRGEGNSCLLIGSRGSGKTTIIERVLGELGESDPIVIRLSGHVQTSDRLAMREIARQLVTATGGAGGGAFLSEEDEEEDAEAFAVDDDDDENPFLNTSTPADGSVGVRLPPTAHLPSLIGTLPTLGRPVVVVLDAFDLFALHPRQALLYCLLDTVQHSAAASIGAHFSSNASSIADAPKKWSGLAVVGATTRVDTLELLEKRVKSRFSGRMFRTAGPSSYARWENLVHSMLLVTAKEAEPEWDGLWDSAVESLMKDREVKEAIKESAALVKDVKIMCRGLVSIFAFLRNRRMLTGSFQTQLLLSLSPENPWPTSSALVSSFVAQRAPSRFGHLHTLPYPSLCLLVAAIHARTAGLPTVTFAQLSDSFREQVRRAAAAPVQVAGGALGMVKCSRGLLQGAFEDLVKTNVFSRVDEGRTRALERDFVKYRFLPDREEVKRAIEKGGGTNLKKWFAKAG
jgi:origin recognition complex subunit 4